MSLTVAVLIIAIGLALIVAAAVSTRQPPLRQIPSSRPERLELWRQLHDAEGDPTSNPLVGGFLRFTHALAAPLARLGVNPDLLTVTGLWLSACAATAAWAGGRWPLLAALTVIISSLTDGVDGAVAGFTGRSSDRGHVLDSVVDRLSEVFFFAALVAAGGTLWSACLGMGTVMLLEYTRARALVARRGTLITIGERPTRVIGVVVSLVGMGVVPGSASFIGTWGAVIVAVATCIGWLQICRSIAKW